MVYAQAARKTLGYMALSLVLSLSIVTFLSGGIDTSATGRVTSPGIANGVDSGSWMIFMLGMFVGMLLIGTYIFVAHIERKRDE